MGSIGKSSLARPSSNRQVLADLKEFHLGVTASHSFDKSGSRINGLGDEIDEFFEMIHRGTFPFNLATAYVIQIPNVSVNILIGRLKNWFVPR